MSFTATHVTPFKACLLIHKLQVAPEVDVESEVGPLYTAETWQDAPEAKSKAFSAGRRPGQTNQKPKASAHRVLDAPPIYQPSGRGKSLDVVDDGYVQEDIGTDFNRLRLDGELGNRFHDTSSGLNFVQAALDKDLIKPRLIKSARPKFWRPICVGLCASITYNLSLTPWPSGRISSLNQRLLSTWNGRLRISPPYL